jgi:hypothetical protein
MAAVMAENGLPTPIDFSKQNAIAVTEKDTDTTKKLIPKSLTQRADTITFRYEIKVGAKQTSFTKPVLLILTDNDYEGKINLESFKVK